MKYFVVLILMLFLTLQIVYAETKIFSGTVITDADKVIDGGTFKFKYDENSKKAFVDTPAGALIVENGACKPNSIFRVCINRANFSHKNITTYVYYYEIDTTIYKLTGSLSATSKAALSSLLQGESTESTITITNPTEFDITNIAFSYDFTPFSVIGSKGCELKDNILEWRGSLKSKYDKTCTATIIAGKEGKYSLSGNLSYFNGFDTEKKTTDALVITVLPKQLKVSQLIDKNIGVEPFYLNISLQNVHASEDINSLATITIPSHVSLIKDSPVFEKNARVLKHSLLLKPGASINYSLYMEKLSEGREPINLKFSYAIKGINDLIENNTYVDIIVAQLTTKPTEIKQEKEKSNETINLTTTSEVKTTQITSENETTEAKPSENKTTEQTTLIDIQKPKLFNKNILLLIAVILISFLIVITTIFKIKKGRKKDEAIEKLKEEIKSDESKPF